MPVVGREAARVVLVQHLTWTRAGSSDTIEYTTRTAHSKALIVRGAGCDVDLEAFRLERRQQVLAREVARLV